MSFGIPALQSKAPQPTLKEGAYGLPDVLTYGVGKIYDNATATTHPLETSEKNFLGQQERMEFTMLRKTQGLHAPLRLVMERRAAKQIGRLPFLPSSNLQLEVLRGNDLTLDFTDVLHTSDTREGLYSPHAVVEKSLGLL